jgi:hypothetical protein
MSMKEILMMHNVVLSVQEKEINGISGVCNFGSISRTYNISGTMINEHKISYIIFVMATEQNVTRKLIKYLHLC